jgi:inner membrane protein
MESPSPQSPIQDPSVNRFLQWLRNSLAIKLGIIGFLVLILLIPLAMIRGIISERGARSQDVQYEVRGTFGGEQTFTGPVLSIPYTYPVTEIRDKEKVTEYLSQKVYFLPEDLDINANVTPEVKPRGIFSAVVYNTVLEVKGTFAAPDFTPYLVEGATVNWEKARMSVGLSDLRSIQDQVSVKWNDTTLLLNPGESITSMMQSALESPVVVKEGDSVRFSFRLAFGGSSTLHFTPLGKETRVKMDSEWQSPSFIGAFFPDKKSEGNSFPAEWKILHLNRPYPQQFLEAPSNLRESDFGVSLVQPVNGYSQTERCVKYGVLIIALTFMVFFFTQAITRRQVHNLQYLVVGFGLVLFYLLLVSLSEHLTFFLSYFLASAAIVVLVTAYMAAIFRKLSLAGISFASLAGLYAFIYVLVQQEDYALIMGSVGLLVVLAILMFLTRRMDWLKGKKAGAEGPSGS